MAESFISSLKRERIRMLAIGLGLLTTGSLLLATLIPHCRHGRKYRVNHDSDPRTHSSFRQRIAAPCWQGFRKIGTALMSSLFASAVGMAGRNRATATETARACGSVIFLLGAQNSYGALADVWPARLRQNRGTDGIGDSEALVSSQMLPSYYKSACPEGQFISTMA